MFISVLYFHLASLSWIGLDWIGIGIGIGWIGLDWIGIGIGIGIGWIGLDWIGLDWYWYWYLVDWIGLDWLFASLTNLGSYCCVSWCSALVCSLFFIV